MLFEITRTSTGGKPCDAAFRSENVNDDPSRWFVDIDTLEGLEEFVAKHGDCIVFPGRQIEIYDEERES